MSAEKADDSICVGQAKIARIEETYQPVYKPKDLFPEWSDEIYNQHKSWLVPNHYDRHRTGQTQRA
jgi:hypothetical protein